MTNEEKKLLKRLNAGELDGLVGDDITTKGGSRVWTSIKDGIPTRYKQGPGGRFFNGKENESIEGVRHILDQWNTNEEKLSFLKQYGWLTKDEDANKYSAKFKPKW